ncbi:hypothetical protein BJ684DRAFT_20256 [Piptocephalis cylindrospora]|uniref:Uncharacterized protein n=1 Tax=Piptocephalis cylindrospora TaxID=1907219 RepID=A0A4V1IY41_9FUNG|nr:hypothetical protein BJ684DRAFT_20256 [Piptocephalis cylindrospora]|eukprot:RKP13239.1 hypothetical protein BJ684DRAFT_20256 [Piptocephalis cylindrospora]
MNLSLAIFLSLGMIGHLQGALALQDTSPAHHVTVIHCNGPNATPDHPACRNLPAHSPGRSLHSPARTGPTRPDSGQRRVIKVVRTRVIHRHSPSSSPMEHKKHRSRKLVDDQDEDETLPLNRAPARHRHRGSSEGPAHPVRPYPTPIPISRPRGPMAQASPATGPSGSAPTTNDPAPPTQRPVPAQRPRPPIHSGGASSIPGPGPLPNAQAPVAPSNSPTTPEGPISTQDAPPTQDVSPDPVTDAVEWAPSPTFQSSSDADPTSADDAIPFVPNPVLPTDATGVNATTAPNDTPVVSSAASLLTDWEGLRWIVVMGAVGARLIFH